MRMLRILFILVIVLIPLAGCIHSDSGPGGGDSSWQQPPPPPPPSTSQAKSCGGVNPKADDIEIQVAADGTVDAKDQYHFFEKPGQKITWTLNATGRRLELVFESPVDDEDTGTTHPDSPFKIKRMPQDRDRIIRVMRTGNPATNCGAHKYTIQVWNGTTLEGKVDPILIIRE